VRFKRIPEVFLVVFANGGYPPIDLVADRLALRADTGTCTSAWRAVAGELEQDVGVLAQRASDLGAVGGAGREPIAVIGGQPFPG
jgi:hypothetical protein